MKLKDFLISLAITACLMVTFIGAGLGVCMLPPSTTALASLACQESSRISPYDAAQLIEGAQATSDYTIWGHDLHKLELTEANMLVELYDANKTACPLSSTAATTLRKAVDASRYGDSPDYLSVETTLSSLDDRYVLDAEAISHLDDVFDVVRKAIIALGIIAILAVAGIIFLIRGHNSRRTGLVFLLSGGLVLLAFAGAGVWAAMDFYTFFNAFHSLFFSAGSWLFNYDSLLICMLPQNFWIGMGAIWLITTAALSLISVIKGMKYLRK